MRLAIFLHKSLLYFEVSQVGAPTLQDLLIWQILLTLHAVNSFFNHDQPTSFASAIQSTVGLCFFIE